MKKLSALSGIFWFVLFYAGVVAGVAMSAPAPRCGFAQSENFGLIPFLVQYENYSAWLALNSWDFKDGTLSAERNPSHIFEEEGLYDVALTVTHKNGVSNSCNGDGVLAVAVLPEFESSDTNGKTPFELEVAFFNKTIVAEGVDYDSLEFEWKFGDGDTSTQKNPVHVYAEGGSYKVSLTAFCSSGCGYGSYTMTKSIYVDEVGYFADVDNEAVAEEEISVTSDGDS